MNKTLTTKEKLRKENMTPEQYEKFRKQCNKSMNAYYHIDPAGFKRRQNKWLEKKKLENPNYLNDRYLKYKERKASELYSKMEKLKRTNKIKYNIIINQLNSI